MDWQSSAGRNQPGHSSVLAGSDRLASRPAAEHSKAPVDFDQLGSRLAPQRSLAAQRQMQRRRTELGSDLFLDLFLCRVLVRQVGGQRRAMVDLEGFARYLRQLMQVRYARRDVEHSLLFTPDIFDLWSIVYHVSHQSEQLVVQ